VKTSFRIWTLDFYWMVPVCNKDFLTRLSKRQSRYCVAKLYLSASKFLIPRCTASFMKCLLFRIRLTGLMNPDPVPTADQEQKGRNGPKKGKRWNFIIRRARYSLRRVETCPGDLKSINQKLKAALRIRDILVRIRIRGSVPLTNGSGSCHFRYWPSRRQ
jgi:hypothetical protein